MLSSLSSINTELSRLYGLTPLLIIGISWEGDTPIRYSTEEPIGTPIYKYVKSYGDLTIVNHVEGIGGVSSLSVTMFDAYGHFKGKFDTKNIYDLSTVATVSLAMLKTDGTVTGTNLLFEGRIEDPVWSEESKEVTFEIVSTPIEAKIGFTPKKDMVIDSDPNYDMIQKYLNEKTWPMVFGSVTNMEAVPLYTVKDEVTVETEVLVVSDGTETVFDPIDVSDEIPYPLSTPMSVWIFDNDIILDCEGSFVDAGGGNLQFQATSITNILWEPGEGEGVALPSGGDHGGAQWLLTTLPPIPLKGMMIYKNCIFGDRDQFGTDKCLEQDSLFFRVDRNTIYTFTAETGYPVPEPTYYILKVGKNLDVETTIKVGARIISKTDTNFQRYIVDTKLDSVVTSVKRQSDLTKIEIPEERYTVSNTAAFWSPSADYAIPHEPCTYVQFTSLGFWEFYQEFVSGAQTGPAVFVDVTSTITLESAVLTYLIEKIGYVIDTSLILEDEELNFMIDTEESASELISAIAWQGAKAIRFHDNESIQIVDLLSPHPSVLTLGNDDIKLNSLRYSFSPRDEVFTFWKYSIRTSDMEAELDKYNLKINVDKYGELVRDEDIYVYENRAAGQTRIDFWNERLSEAYHQVEFVCDIKNLILELWDNITIAVSNINFQSVSESPLHYVSGGSSTAWNGTGTIKELKIDWENKEVAVLVRFQNRIGTI